MKTGYFKVKEYREKVKFVSGKNNDVEDSPYGELHKFKQFVYLYKSEAVLIVFGKTPEETRLRAKKIIQLVNKHFNLK